MYLLLSDYLPSVLFLPPFFFIGIYWFIVINLTLWFIQGLTPKFMGETLTEMQFSFWNLIEFHLIMEGAMYCNPYDIVSFPKNCQYLEKIFIDVSIGSILST